MEGVDREAEGEFLSLDEEGKLNLRGDEKGLKKIGPLFDSASLVASRVVLPKVDTTNSSIDEAPQILLKEAKLVELKNQACTCSFFVRCSMGNLDANALGPMQGRSPSSCASGQRPHKHTKDVWAMARTVVEELHVREGAVMGSGTAVGGEMTEKEMLLRIGAAAVNVPR